MADDAEVVELAGQEVRITSPGKVLFYERGETKLDLVRYYAAVAEPLLRTMGGRPVLMQRFPQGASGKSFFQKRVPDNAPEWLQTTTVETATARRRARWWPPMSRTWRGRSTSPASASTSGRTSPRTPSTPTSCAWTSTPRPGPGSPRCARPRWELKALLDEHGIVGFPKTTGNRGLHVYVRLEPRWDSYQVRSAAVAVARELERRRPDILTAAWWKEERGKRIFVDYNQNAPHKTVFGAWSVRARKGAQVSTPLSWDELDDVDPDELTLATCPGAWPRRRPVGDDQRRPAVAGAAAGDARARPGRRPDGRAVAARLPEAARRAAAVARAGPASRGSRPQPRRPGWSRSTRSSRLPAPQADAGA